MNKISELPNHYASIDNLTLYRWDKYTQTKDNNWFLIDYDGRQTKLDSEDLKAVENDLVDQYFKAIDDRSFSNKMKKWGKIDWLKRKYESCHLLLDSLKTIVAMPTDDIQSERRLLYIFELKKWRLIFPLLNTVYDDIILINEYKQALEGITTEIALLGKELIKEGREESKDLYYQIAIAKTILPGYEMNPRIMVLKEWIFIQKIIEEKAKNN